MVAEVAASGDECLCEQYMEQQRPSSEQLKAAIRRGTLTRSFVPILIGSALKNRGVQLLMDAMLEYLPNPAQVHNKAFVEQTYVSPRDLLVTTLASQTRGPGFNSRADTLPKFTPSPRNPLVYEVKKPVSD